MMPSNFRIGRAGLCIPARQGGHISSRIRVLHVQPPGVGRERLSRDRTGLPGFRDAQFHGLLGQAVTDRPDIDISVAHTRRPRGVSSRLNRMEVSCRGVSLERRPPSSARGLPDLERPVIAVGGQPFAIVAEGEGRDALGMPRTFSEQSPGPPGRRARPSCPSPRRRGVHRDLRR